ncbi:MULTISPECIES: DctP family TRAP transporter solute-binding subunit [unclassified Lysinibacillus]|uniref:DctP family TRAP transporter solute-binding subunit n=1 Tax=unclassified Lysinibacillus TaxID=2636778 RepID=UPI00131F3AF4|nr:MULTISPECIES: DctP family TRAP transporter solute-binding subunit [unclassified Lysinibacillus]
MRFYVITALITITVLVVSISFRLDVWNQKELPYDDEQIGLDDQIIINFSHVVAENTPKGIAATKFAELVKEKSDGKMIVQIFPNGILYNDENELSALKQGDIEMIAPTISKMTESLPSWQVLDLPFIFENDEQVYEVLHGELSKNLLHELNSIDIHGLTFWHNGFKQMASQSTPLLEVEDFNNLSIRSMPSTILKEQFTLLKAKPIVTTFNDLYAASQNNEILAQENTISNLYSKGYYAMQPNITLSNHGILAYSVLMNEDFWESLNNKQQKIIEDSLDEMQQWQHDQAIALNKENLKQLRSINQVQIQALSAEQLNHWKQALHPIYKSYEKLTAKGYLSQLRREINTLE